MFHQADYRMSATSFCLHMELTYTLKGLIDMLEGFVTFGLWTRSEIGAFFVLHVKVLGVDFLFAKLRLVPFW